jgi:hypothetical protein
MVKEKKPDEKTPTVKYKGKSIPKTKDGYPNAVYLDKEDKAILKKYKADKKFEKKKGSIKELMEILKGVE